MAGKKLLPPNPKDFTDPFNAGQMVGMLTILMFIEKNGGISEEMMQRVKWTCANNASVFFQVPSEDIFLTLDNLVKEIK
jgi:hypothetical protein